MPTYHLNCETCGQPFTAVRAATQRPPRFCSRKCFGTSQGKPLKRYERKCERCGKRFETKRAADASPPKFCSYACYHAGPRITRGRTRTDQPVRGRRQARRKANGEIVKTSLARWVWNETHPDDPAGPNDHIHHIDGDALNDNSSNLAKVTAEEHMDIHRTFKRPGSAELSRRMRSYHKANPGKQRKGQPKSCPICGVEFYRPPSAKAETCSYACQGKLRTLRRSQK